MKMCLNSFLVLAAILTFSNVTYAGRVLKQDENTFWIKCNNGWISDVKYATQAAAEKAMPDVCSNSGGIVVKSGIKLDSGKK